MKERREKEGNERKHEKKNEMKERRDQVKEIKQKGENYIEM